MKLSWSDVDLQEGKLTVRDAKNEDDRAIPLSIASMRCLPSGVKSGSANVGKQWWWTRGCTETWPISAK